MLRTALFSAGVLVLCACAVRADEKTTNETNKKGTKHEATITKIDPQNGTVTVRMKDKTGKEENRTFKLTEDVRMWDSEGHVARIDFFRSGNEVLVVEHDGRLMEMRPHHKGTGTGQQPSTTEKRPGGGK